MKRFYNFFLSLMIAMVMASLIVPPSVFAKSYSRSSSFRSSSSSRSSSWGKSSSSYSSRKSSVNTKSFDWGRKKTKSSNNWYSSSSGSSSSKPTGVAKKAPKKAPVVKPTTTAKAPKKAPVVKQAPKVQTQKKAPVVKQDTKRGPPTVQTAGKKVQPKKLAGIKGRDLNTSLKQRSAAQGIKDRRAKYQKPSNSNSVNINTRSKMYQRSTTRQTRTVREVYVVRDNYYNGWHTPAWGYHYAPTYGMWSTDYLTYALMHGHYGLFYHHYHDGGMGAYRRELRAQAAENAELAAKLDEMERKVNTMEQQGVSRNEEYLPEGVSPEVAMATEIVAKQDEVVTSGKPIIHAASGGTLGVYYRTVATMARIAQDINAPFEINPMSTAGSMHNLEGFGTDYDIIMCQSDAADLYLRKNGNAKLGNFQVMVYPEYFQLFVNADSKIKDAGDLDPKKNMIIVGPKGSGPEASWNNIKYHASQGWFGDDKYGKINVTNMSYEKGLEMVSKNPNVAMLYVAGMNNGVAKMADSKFAGKIKLVPFQEGKFLKATDRDGEDVYTEAKIPAVYNNLQPKGFFGTKAVNSLTVMAVMAISERIVKDHPEWEDDLKSIVMLTIGEMRDFVGYEE